MTKIAAFLAVVCALVLVYQLLTGPEPQPDIFHYDAPEGPAPVYPVTPALRPSAAAQDGRFNLSLVYPEEVSSP